MNDVVVAQPKSGWRTSEFWLSLFALIATPLLATTDTVVQNTAQSVATHNAANSWGILAPALISMAYGIGRSYVKAKTAQMPDTVVVAQKP